MNDICQPRVFKVHLYACGGLETGAEVKHACFNEIADARFEGANGSAQGRDLGKHIEASGACIEVAHADHSRVLRIDLPAYQRLECEH